MDHIDTYLATATQNGSYSASIRAALAIGKRTLNRYYNKTDHSEVYRIAMSTFYSNMVNYINKLLVLHPRHKLHYFKTAGWQPEWIEAAHVILQEEFDRTYAFMDWDNEILPKVRDLRTYC
jgi:hypothetical protein